jgi:hypothetical protein
VVQFLSFSWIISRIMAAFFGFLLGVPALIGLVLLGVVWRTWWLFPAWAWYVVPLGVRQISFWHFAALTALIGTLTHSTGDTKKDDRQPDWAKMIITPLLTPVFAWMLLWWLHER